MKAAGRSPSRAEKQLLHAHILIIVLFHEANVFRDQWQKKHANHAVNDLVY